MVDDEPEDLKMMWQKTIHAFQTPLGRNHCRWSLDELALAIMIFAAIYAGDGAAHNLCGATSATYRPSPVMNS